MSSDPNTSRAGGWLSRLKGLVQSMKPNEKPPATQETLPAWEATPPPLPGMPIEEANGGAVTAQPVESATPPQAAEAEISEETPLAQQVEAEPVAEAAPAAELPSPPLAEPAAPAPILCPICAAARQDQKPFCADCGYYFKPEDFMAANPAPSSGDTDELPIVDIPTARLKDRFETRERISERCGVTRYRGLDYGGGAAVPVVIVRQAVARSEALPSAEEVPTVEPIADDEVAEEVLPDFDEMLDTPAPIAEIVSDKPLWPSLDWEQQLLSALEHPGLPVIVDRFREGDFDYLVEEVPAGRLLWDAWDDPESDSAHRFGYLAEVAEILKCLHRCNVIVEGLRPELIVVAADGRARLADVGDLLPLPLPNDLPLRRTFYTAPEVLEGKADARADLYSFGAMLYALHVGRDVNEIDFDRSGVPQPFIPRFPDIHPALGRLMTKTFRKEVEGRFPSDEASREDATGFTELIRTLQTLARTFDNVRLEIAAWTTTGMVRTGNEDAFALLHACESRQDDLSETALLLLCDGMGGYEAGEVAAALAIQIMREYLVKHKPFAPLSGASSFLSDALHPPTGDREGWAAPPIVVAEMKKLLKGALKEANRQIYVASRAPGSKRRGMGCTAEAVYVDGRNIVVGHVGDSRTYHLREGRLIQMTRDQTLVNRLVELGTLSPEEAETHPRRNELQQAVGGQPDVEPGLYQSVLKAGDWVIVCSDGLTNHVSNADLEQMLHGEGYSAETVARRLVNLANLQGATDNATVVVIRAT